MDFEDVCVSCLCAGITVFAAHQVWYYSGIHGSNPVILPFVADSGLSIGWVVCVWWDLDCGWVGLLVVYKVPVYTVVVRMMVDILVVYMVVCSYGVDVVFLVDSAGILG